MSKHRKLTYANVASTLALVLSLSGVGIAAVRLAQDSVTTRELANDAVRNENIAPGAVSFRNIAPKLREQLVSIVTAHSSEARQIPEGEFQDFLTKDLASAGDSGQRLVEGNIELTNPTTDRVILVGIRLIDVTSGEEIVRRRFSIQPGQTVVIPLLGVLETVGPADIRMQIRVEGGPVQAEDASMSVTTTARRHL